ncbi:histidine ammonia-lyase/tyrosine ammonia-lyase [Actinocorallia herbida]|uniref:Histidine ammonia-lyase/tyrosine ammonia-lyase n=1 Tax=Actinocorallia herbida TaxID=58109 RepID=A0A3N1CZY6_9ACTN|nr:aromatic amino acid ammonia-lyase [Actinocorallia herbida]ROO86844.1 histidine ammonia-lyase/tyrosine ammonia-lyase [Actinocorallia herbida]
MTHQEVLEGRPESREDRSGVAVLPVPGRLTTAELELAARGPVRVAIADDAAGGVAAGHAFMLACVERGQDIYGVTTGFGNLVGFAGRATAHEQSEGFLDFLTAGHGPDLPPEVMRATLLARVWSLAKGRSAVSPSALRTLTAVLETSFAPAVPRMGSVGASGDLIPLAYAVRAMQGQGHAYVDGARMPAAEALDRCGLSPLHLAGRDAVALVNGTSVTAAAAGLALASLARSVNTAVTLTALLADLLGSDPGFAAAPTLAAFGHPQGEDVAAGLRALLKGTVPTGTRPLQEPYSIRCSPQLIGASASALHYAATVIGDDLNGINDNPLFFAEDEVVTHGGNFFSQPVAFAADTMSTVAAQLANLAERQLDLLTDTHRNSGLPPMLATEPGRQHGVVGMQISATATVAAMRRAAVPVSNQSLPTNGHNQDVVPLGTQAALTALDQAGQLRWVQGALGVALRQAGYLSPRGVTAPACAAVLHELSAAVTPIDPDRPLDADVRRAGDLLDRLAAARAPWRGAPCAVPSGA